MKDKKQNNKVKDPLPELTSLYNNLNELSNADEVLEREVVKIGNGAHINIPLKHLGKKAKVIITKKEEVKN